jgi:hypothetical protein
MRDLSVFRGPFDIVWQVYSLNFVPPWSQYFVP